MTNTNTSINYQPTVTPENYFNEEITKWYTANKEWLCNNAYMKPDEIDKEFQIFMETLNNMFKYGDAPGDIFDFLGNGSFKECYSVNIPGIVVKFASLDNPTDYEQEGLLTFHDNDFGDMCVKTWFFDLPKNVDLVNLETESNPDYEGDDDDCDEAWRYQQADTMIIQERVIPMTEVSGADTSELWRPEYEKNPIVWEGKIVDFRMVRNVCDTGRTWIKEFLREYGYDKFIKFSTLLDEECIEDLRAANVGLNKEGKPVIFDYMSH